MCGGKTGSMYGFNLVPDIFCVGKAYGGGYFPIAAAVMQPHVYDEVSKQPFFGGYTHTFHMPGILGALYYRHLLDRERTLENVPAIIERAKHVCGTLNIEGFNNYGTMFVLKLPRKLDTIMLDALLLEKGLNMGFVVIFPTTNSLVWCVPIVADDYYFEQVQARLSAALAYRED